MKRLLLLLALTISAFRADAAITFVQARAATSNSTPQCGTSGVSPCALAFLSNVTAGHLIYVSFSCEGCGSATITATDTVGSTYAAIDAKPHGTVNFNAFNFWASANASGANTVSVAFSAGTFQVIQIAEYSGALVIDTHNTGSGASLSASTDNIVTANAVDVVVCSVHSFSSTASPTVSAPYTQRASAGFADAGWLYDQIVAATGTFTCPSTFTTSSNNDWIALGVAFKASASVRHRAYSQ